MSGPVVTQAAMDAANAWLVNEGYAPSLAEMLSLQLAFAQFEEGLRTQAEAASKAREDALVEALRAIRDRKWNSMTQGCDAMAEAQSAARAALALIEGFGR